MTSVTFSIFCPVQTPRLHASFNLSIVFHTGDMWPWPLFPVARFTIEHCKFTVVGKKKNKTSKQKNPPKNNLSLQVTLSVLKIFCGCKCKW